MQRPDVIKKPGANERNDAQRIAVDRAGSGLSEIAQSLLDLYRIENANDPLAVLITILDKMQAEQYRILSRIEAANVLADVEFGRIDLAVTRVSEMQQAAQAVLAELSKLQKDFRLTTDKIRERRNVDILLNHLQPLIYGLFGSLITLLVIIFFLRSKIL
ncbi:MAG: hypothetical protein JO076_08635 [Verrucomicrobia bacterium]|nr:hypothetical protein [Verrucomicrobiota bacterium]